MSIGFMSSSGVPGSAVQYVTEKGDGQKTKYVLLRLEVEAVRILARLSGTDLKVLLWLLARSAGCYRDPRPMGSYDCEKRRPAVQPIPVDPAAAAADLGLTEQAIVDSVRELACRPLEDGPPLALMRDGTVKVLPDGLCVREEEDDDE